MAITETLVSERNQVRSITANEPEGKAKENPIPTAGNKATVSREYRWEGQENRGGPSQNGQNGHQNGVDNRDRRQEGQQNPNNQNYYRQPGNNDARRETRSCYLCNTPGHLMANCRGRAQNAPYNGQRNGNGGRAPNQNFH